MLNQAGALPFFLFNLAARPKGEKLLPMNN